MTCHLCLALDAPDPRLSTTGHLCQVHLDTLAQVLRDIGHLYTHVSSAQFLSEQRDRDAERWVGSKAPTDMHTVSLLDYRTVALAKGDPISISRVLKVWTYAILDAHPTGIQFSHDAPMPHQSVSRYIQLHLQLLPWLATHPDVVVRYARHMAALRRQLLRLVPQY